MPGHLFDAYPVATWRMFCDAAHRDGGLQAVFAAKALLHLTRSVDWFMNAGGEAR